MTFIALLASAQKAGPFAVSPTPPWMLNNAIERTDFIRLDKGIEARFVAELQRGARAIT